MIPVGGLFLHTTGHDVCHLDGDLLLLEHETSLLACSLDLGRVAWTVAHGRPAPSHYCIPRRIRTNGRRIWTGDSDVVAYLFDVEDGVRVQAYDRTTGLVRWQRDFLTPAPAS
jgi:hypothetical protein